MLDHISVPLAAVIQRAMNPVKQHDRAYFLTTGVRQMHGQRGDREMIEYELRSELAKAYREGYAAAVREYAVWNDGEQFVGVQMRPLHTVLAEIEAMPVNLEPHHN